MTPTGPAIEAVLALGLSMLFGSPLPASVHTVPRRSSLQHEYATNMSVEQKGSEHGNPREQCHSTHLINVLLITTKGAHAFQSLLTSITRHECVRLFESQRTLSHCYHYYYCHSPKTCFASKGGCNNTLRRMRSAFCSSAGLPVRGGM